ncbi:MAG: hypothetical protein C4318_07180 [Acidimicrobiia bacterium]
MPSETLSHGPARSYESLVEAVLVAFESAGLSAGGFIDLHTRLDALEIDDVDLLDLAEMVAEDLGERGLAHLDGSELAECETVGDFVLLLAVAAGLDRSKGES